MTFLNYRTIVIFPLAIFFLLEITYWIDWYKEKSLSGEVIENGRT